jgi:autotransporter-associated beta strand protein
VNTPSFFSGTTQVGLTGVVSGTGGIAKTGPGTLFLGNSNTYSGLTQINAGTLGLTHAQGLGSTTGATVVANGATLEVRNIAAAAEPLTLNGSGFDTGGGIFTGALAATGTASLAGNITLGSTSAVRTDGTEALTLTGAIGDSGGAPILQKLGSGTLTLAGANTYSGRTFASQGTLRVTNTQGLGTAAGGTEVGADSTLELNNVAIGAEPVTLGAGILSSATLRGTGASSLAGNITLSGATSISATGTLTLSGVIGESGGARGFTKTSNGTLVLSGANSFSGSVNVFLGSLEIQNAQALGSAAGGTSVSGALRLNNVAVGAEPISLGGGSLTGIGVASLAGNITLTGSSTIVSTDSFTLTGSIGQSGGARALTKTGGGILILQGTGGYTGATNVNLGTLRVGSSANTIHDQSAVSVASSAVLDLNGFNEAIGNLSGAGSVLLGAGSLTLGGDSAAANFSGTVSGAGGIGKVGTGAQTLSGANTYSGGTTVLGGKLMVNNTSGSGTGPGAVSVTSGATLGGSGIIGGLTTLRAGATLTPGNSPGLMTFLAGLAADPEALIEFEIGGTTAISQYDVIDVSGTASLAAGADIRIVPFDLGAGPYQFAAGDVFDLLIADQIAADLASLDYFLPTLSSGLAFDFDIVTLGGREALHLTVVPEPATWLLLLAAGLPLLIVRRRQLFTAQT